jgi:hypothetical protein
MAKADSVLSTPLTNTPVDTTRRRFLAVAAVASAVSAGTLAAAAAMDPSVPAAVTMPRHSTPDPAFALIAEKLAADAAHGVAIDAQDEAEGADGSGSDAAEETFQRRCVACGVVNEADWRLSVSVRGRCRPAISGLSGVCPACPANALPRPIRPIFQ